jgi:hypothetical protein
MPTIHSTLGALVCTAAILLNAFWWQSLPAYAAPYPATQAPAGCPATMAFGETILCSLSVTGDTGSFTFTATAGDRVIVRMGRRSSGLNPRVQLVAPDATILCQAYSYGDVADIAECLLPSSGTYTLLASNYNSTATGNYSLALQRLNTPVSASTLDFGQTHLDALAVAGQFATYTFAGATGDSVLARMGSTTSALSPHLRIYQPNGESLCAAYSYAAAHDIAGCLLPSDGQYTLVLSDYAGVATGSYGISLQRLNDPSNVTPLSFGDTLPKTITAAGEIDTYTFAASASDTVVVRMGSAATTLDPHIRVYGPDGVKLCEVASYNRAITSYGCLLPNDGSYSILVNDYSGADTGTYGISLQRVNPPSQAQPLVFGQRRSADLVLPGELDTYTFSAESADTVLVRMGSEASAIYPQMWIFGPNGALVCNANGYPSAVEIPGCILPSDGSYTILANTYNSAATGSYGLTLQRLNNPGNATPVLFGHTKAGAIDTRGAFDTYTFAAHANSPVSVRMTSPSGGIYPSVRLYGPDGALLCQASNYPGTAEIGRCVLPSNATYTLIATNYNGAGTGNYSLSLLCLAEDCGPAATILNVLVPVVRK